MARLKPLSPKQQRFVSEYLKDQNGTQAAIRAGYSPKTAQEQSSRLLSKDMISEKINDMLRKVEDKAIVDASYVLKGLKRVHERCLKPEPVMEFDRDSRDMIQKTDSSGNLVYEFDSAGANRSLELLGKHLKLFTDKTELSADASLAEILKANLRADAE